MYEVERSKQNDISGFWKWWQWYVNQACMAHWSNLSDAFGKRSKKVHYDNSQLNPLIPWQKRFGNFKCAFISPPRYVIWKGFTENCTLIKIKDFVLQFIWLLIP